MTPKNSSSGNSEAQNNSSDKSKSSGLGCLILIIIILIVCFWRFIDYRTADWVGHAREGYVESFDNNLPNTIDNIPPPMSDSPPFVPITGDAPHVARTVMEYDSEFLRWAGELAPSQYATWGKLTIESPEIIVGGSTGPKPPVTIRGNIREVEGVGIDFIIFDEKNYLAWQNGETNVQSRYLGKNLSDYNYALDISQGTYYIVAENTSVTEHAFIGFTGVLSYARDVVVGETPSNLEQNFFFVWEIENEKLTILEYIFKLFQSPYNTPMTPPSITEKVIE